jgi:hypothetical protein
MADPFLIADQLYNLGMQYSNLPQQEPGPLGTAGYASTPFGDKLIGPSSFFGPRLVSTPQGDVYYGPTPLAGPKFGDVAPTLDQAKAMEIAAPAAAAAAPQQPPFWMQSAPSGATWGGEGGLSWGGPGAVTSDPYAGMQK